MIDNPFTSQTFSNIWFDGFATRESKVNVQGIEGIDFFNKGGIHINAGKTHTKGIHYCIENSTISLKGKTCLIYDIPAYFDCPGTSSKKIKVKKVKQYPGFLIALNPYESLSDFMQKKFKKSSRYKLNKYYRRLSECFDISVTMYRGEMKENEFDSIFEKFRMLLEKRFQGKGEHNNNLDQKEWDFYKKVAYPMILKKKAGLFVIFDKDEPIAVTLNYFSKDIIFDAITVFDTAYAKFHLGSVNIMYLITWGIANGFKTLDFSKGYFDYKTRWATQQYDFEYHIIYDPKCILSSTKATVLSSFFTFKQFLRERELNLILNKLRFILHGDSKINSNNATQKLVFEDIDAHSDITKKTLLKLEPKTKKILFEFLYLFGEAAADVKIFYIENKDQYLLQGKKTHKIAFFT
ncbi:MULTISPECIES: GNAT family N-acetyltransferase [Flavobacteriaceae]|uniref:GNAT family N-acetyltransferase n=1 Tax=Flavobacteriaceae TaxID=49546 RepID=UPI0014921C2F|nr:MULTISPECIES: GNAT family N-acetyltransferase [Allomuricauda]MDC6365077.1 GNAT family N-acetyltransferase [Muricauda sp. AC10]